jgi:uncharacterized membrane protein YphA (DoxX/SURF4 family)
MFAAYVLVNVILAGMLLASAAMKLSHRPDVVDSYARVGVPEHRLNALAGLLILGALGLLSGYAWRPIAVMASAALVVYFAVAITAHVRAKDIANITTPIVIELLSMTALVLNAMPYVIP